MVKFADRLLEMLKADLKQPDFPELAALRGRRARHAAAAGVGRAPEGKRPVAQAGTACVRMFSSLRKPSTWTG